jgi:hypothetical protein
MALQTAVGSFTVPALTGNQSVTGLAFQPIAVIFWGNGASSDAASSSGTLNTAMPNYLGLAVSSSSRVVITNDDDGSSTSSTSTEDTTKCIKFNEIGVTKFAADFVSMDAAGFTINFTTGFATADVINYLAIGGSDVTNAAIISMASQAGTGNQSATGAGFKPSAVILIGQQAISGQNWGIGFGVSASSRGATSFGYHSSTGFTDTYQRTNRCYALVNNDAVVREADFVSLDASGFTLNWLTAAIGQNLYALCLAGGQYFAGSFLQATGTGNQSTTGVGFRPTGVLMTGAHHAASSTVVTGADLCSMIGAASGTANRAVTVYQSGADAVSLLDRSHVYAAYNTDSTPTLQARADLASFDASGFTLNYGTADATAREVIFFAMGSAAAGSVPFVVDDIGSLPVPTKPYPVEFRTATINLLQSTLAPVVPAPFVTQQGTEPPPTKPYPLDLRTAISYFTLDLNQPFVQGDTTSPPTKSYPIELRTSSYNLLQTTLKPQPYPGLIDALPPTRPYPLDLRTAITDLIANTLKPAQTVPIVADVDLLPPTKPYPLELRTATTALITTTLKPPQTFPLTTQELGLVFGKPYPLELRTATQNLLETTLGPLAGPPFPNYDDPNPPTKPYALELRTFVNNLLQSTLGPVLQRLGAPVSTDLPPTKPYPLDLRTNTLNLLQTTLLPKPFVVLSSDLARPNVPAYPVDLRTSTTNLLVNTLIPPNVPVYAIDAGLTFVRPYPLDLRTTTLNLLQGTLSLVPLRLLDQPLPAPRPAFPLDLRTQTNVLITTTLKPAQTFPEVILVDALPPVRPYPLDLRTALVDILTSTLAPRPPAPTITDTYQLGVVSGFGNSHTPNVGGLHFEPLE